MSINNHKKLLTILMVFGMTLAIFPLSGVAIAEQPNAAPDKTIEEEGQLTFRYESENDQPYEDAPEAPNVWDIVDNVTAFNNPNDTVYVGDDIIPTECLEGMEWSYIEINLTAIYVEDDQFESDSGEISVRYSPYWIGVPDIEWTNYEGAYDETDTVTIESDNSQWYNFTEPITLIADWTVLTSLVFEVFSSDGSDTYSCGMNYFVFEDPSDMEGTWEVDLYEPEAATLVIDITIYDYDTVFTATNITEIFQPLLFDDDDTTHTADPNGLFARVIQGYDNEIEMGSLCIQYLYYWSEVWTDGFWSDQFIHYDDYELVQIYINTTYTEGPIAYRFVYDNHDIYTQSDTEWRDSMEYSIYEFDVEDSDILTSQVNNSEELQPLLGDSYTAHYQYKNLSNYYDAFCCCYGGVASIMLTVETYNHQFAMGDTGYGTLLGQYYIEPYTDDIIEECYGLLNDSFTGGVHDVNGYSIPNYSPFAYDVLQVFTIPYIHSNFDPLMQKAANLQGSTEAKGGALKIEKSINITLEVPISSSLSLPESLTPGTNYTGALETSIRPEAAVLTIDYMFNISFDYEAFFSTKHVEIIIENTLTINFSDPVLVNALDSLGYNGGIENSINLLGGMLEIETLFTPQAIGQILNANLTFHVLEILNYVVPGLGSVLSKIFGDLYFKVNPIISGFVEADLGIGENIQRVHWDQGTQTFNLNIEVPSIGTQNNLDIILDNFAYGLHFEVNWIAGLDYSGIASWFMEDKVYNLGTYPDVDVTLLPLDGSLNNSLAIEEYVSSDDGSEWIRSDIAAGLGDEDLGTGIPGFPVEAIMVISILSMIAVVVFINRKRMN